MFTHAVDIAVSDGWHQLGSRQRRKRKDALVAYFSRHNMQLTLCVCVCVRADIFVVYMYMCGCMYAHQHVRKIQYSI